MSRASGGLTKWFKEDWVDIGSKKKNGKYPVIFLTTLDPKKYNNQLLEHF